MNLPPPNFSGDEQPKLPVPDSAQPGKDLTTKSAPEGEQREAPVGAVDAEEKTEVAAEGVQAEELDFDAWQSVVVDAFRYPMRGEGSAVLVTGIILSVIIGVGSWIPIVGFLVMLLGWLYFASYSLSVVETSITGRITPPDWPEFSNAFENVVMPGIQVFLVGLLSVLPGILLASLSGANAGGGLTFFAVLGGIYALVYFPLAMAGLAVTGSIMGAMPQVVWPAIGRCLPGFWQAVAILGLLWFVQFVAEWMLAFVPVLGTLAAVVLSLYVMLVTCRMVASIYLKFQKQIKW